MIAQGTKRTELEAHHAAIRSSSHSSMKTENWFQLRVLGVTMITLLFEGVRNDGQIHRRGRAPRVLEDIAHGSLK